jgi:hypothetical protein
MITRIGDWSGGALSLGFWSLNLKRSASLAAVLSASRYAPALVLDDDGALHLSLACVTGGLAICAIAGQASTETKRNRTLRYRMAGSIGTDIILASAIDGNHD